MRPNDLPLPPHGDSLRAELTDALRMLADACADLASIDPFSLDARNTGAVRSARAQTVAALGLLRSILGTPPADSAPKDHTPRSQPRRRKRRAPRT